MARRFTPALSHLIGCIVTLVVAVVLLSTLFPYLEGLVFPKGARPFGLRGEAIDFLFVALVPVVVWLVPPLMRALASVTHHAHKSILGRSGFYVRFPTPRRVRFRETFVWALGPLAIDLLVIAEIEYYLSGADPGTFNRVLFAIPSLLLAGIVTSLLPGAWLVDALDLRLVNPSKGEVVRESALFEGILGPIGALALLVSFVTLVHSVGESYAEGTVLMAVWASRMFPALLAAVSVYRILIEPDVLPGLQKWADREGIPLTPTLDQALRAVEPNADASSPSGTMPSRADAPRKPAA